MLDAHDQVRQRGVHVREILNALAGGVPRPWTDATAARVRRRFQGAVRDALHTQVFQRPHHRVREKFDRWQLDGLPRVVADRFLDRLVRLKRLFPPRVIAAVFSTAWNRWCTERRFQRRNGPHNRCVLGCGGDAEDSIEHYSRCFAIRRFHQGFLRIADDWLLPVWLGIYSTPVCDDHLARGAMRGLCCLQSHECGAPQLPADWRRCKTGA